MEKKTIYSTIALITLMSLLILAGIGTAIDSSDIDETCNTANSILKRMGGTWQCSVTNYAQGWFHNTTNPLAITISATNTWYNITGFTIDNYEGVDTLENSIRINKNSTYKLTGTASFSGGNSGQYEVSLFVNNIEKRACAFHRTTTSTTIGDATMSCIINLVENDLLSMRIEDTQSPAQTINIQAFNFNIIEIQ